jgi:integrase
MESTQLVDCAGRRRSPATLPGYHRGRPPRNKGLRYPADPPTVEEIISVMRAAGDSPDGVRLRGVIVVLWRAGLRISEALALNESDLDSERGALLVRHGKGDKRREVGMGRWAWEQLHPWLELRASRSGRCFACCGARPAGGRVRPPGSVSSSTRRLMPAAFADGLRRTSCDRHTPSRCPARLSRCWSHSGNSGMPISGSRRCTGADRQHRDCPRRSRAASADDLGHKRASARSLSRPATEAAPGPGLGWPRTTNGDPQPRRRSNASRWLRARCSARQDSRKRAPPGQAGHRRLSDAVDFGLAGQDCCVEPRS